MNIQRFLSALLLLLVSTLVISVHAQSNIPEYRVGAGDVIRVLVYQNPDLTIEARVTENGTITFPLVGLLNVGGRTVAQTEGVIANALRGGGFIRDPQVSILPLQIRSHQVSVLGQVNTPGRYPLETFNTRLSEMIAIAGGISATGADAVIFTGIRNGQPVRLEIDIPAMFVGNRQRDDLVVAGGDVIYVPRAPAFQIYGEIQRPGTLRLEKGMTFRQALAEGGGPTARATENRLTLYRRTADGIGAFVPRLDDLVKAEDVIYVNDSTFYVYGEVQRPGSYRVETDMTLRQALAQGGGPTARGSERRLTLYRRGADGRTTSMNLNLNELVRPDDVLFIGESLF